MQVGVAGKHAQQDDAVGANLDDLGDAWVGVVIANDDEPALYEVDAGSGVMDAGVRQAGSVDPMEVHPEIGIGRRPTAQPSACR